MCTLTSTFNATFLCKLLHTVQLQMLTFFLWSCFHVSMLLFERKEFMVLNNPNILGLWWWFAHVTLKSEEMISLYVRILSILTELNHTCQHTNGNRYISITCLNNHMPAYKWEAETFLSYVWTNHSF